jgi:RNA polymerase sigma-70 factor (ECF subfamily)
MATAIRTLGVLANKRTFSWVRPETQDSRRVFEGLVAQDWDRFYRYAVRLCHGRIDDAEDLLSESMVDAFRAFESFRGEGFDRWFFRMITNNRIDMSRRAKVRRTESLDAGWDDAGVQTLDIADAQGSAESQVLAPLYSEAMQAALNALPDAFRAAVLLCDVEGMDYQEIADTLRIPLGTVRSRIHRGRAQMRTVLESRSADR